MRYFFFFIAVIGPLIFQSAAAEEKLTNYMRNKLAIERAVKIHLAFEARYGNGPGIESDLNLPEKAKFQRSTGEFKPWVFPNTIGLEIKIGTPQRRVVVIAPASAGGRYLMATDDLAVKSYTKSELVPIFEAIKKRREKLSMKPLD